MNKIKSTLVMLWAMVLMVATGCATLQPGADPVAVNAERTLAISLEVVDSVLKYEYDNRDSVPQSVKDATQSIRRQARKAFVAADRIRMDYKNGRASQSKLLLTISLIESLLRESRIWLPPSSASGASDASPGDFTDEWLNDAEESQVISSSMGLASVPMMIGLARQVYSLGLSIKQGLAKDRAWTPAEDAAFRRRLITLTTQPHWRP